MECTSKEFSLLLVAILAVSSLIIAESVDAQQSGTPVGGIISADTMWTPAGDPYTFVDNITVSRGTTLTIMPGTIIDLKLANLVIDGTLIAQGNDADWIIIQAQKRTTFSWPPRIYFNSSSTPWDEKTGTGSIIDHAQISIPNYQYETIMGDYPKISNNIIYNYGSDAAAIRTYGLVFNNTILGGYRGIIAQFNQTILSNTIKNADVGITCGYMSFDPIYYPTIIGNLLINNTVGIDDYGCAPYIANNTIANSKRGIFLTSYAFYREAAPTAVIYNNIYANEFNVYVEAKNSSKIVTMANNWWGTTSLSEIMQLVYDYRNDSSLARVYCTPYLTLANPMAPSSTEINPNPSPSPTHNQTPTATPSSTSTPTPWPTATAYPTATPTTTPLAILDLSCSSSVSYDSFRVEITGKITENDKGLAATPISISYSVTNGRTWQDLTSVSTYSDGKFSVVWTPLVTGNYVIKASWVLDDSVSAIVNLAVLPFTDATSNSIFSVSSNSTISDLAFNSTSHQLTFTITGATGTSGYTDVIVAKSLIKDNTQIQVYLDGEQVQYLAKETTDSWLLHFTYQHSTHEVTLQLNSTSTNSTSQSQYVMYANVGVVIAVGLIAATFVLKKRNKKN